MSSYCAGSASPAQRDRAGRPAAGAAPCRDRITTTFAGPANSCCGSATRCTSPLASRTTCWTAPSKCGWPKFYGYQGSAGMLPVEQFMQEYFRMTDGSSHMSSRFVTTARSAPVWLEVFSPLIQPPFRAGFSRQPEFCFGQSAAAWKRCAATSPKFCGWPTWPIVTTSGSHMPRAKRSAHTIPICRTSVTPEVAQRFLSLHGSSGAAGRDAAEPDEHRRASRRSFRPLPTPARCCSSTNTTSTRSTSIACAPSKPHRLLPR